MRAGGGRLAIRIAMGLWLLVFLALFFSRGYPAVTLILLFTVVYLIAAFLAVCLGGKRLNADFAGDGLVEKGEAMEFQVRVANKGWMPVFCCTCELEAQNMLTGTAELRTLPFSLGPKAAAEQDMTLSDDCCGKIRVRLRRIVVEDPLRLFAGSRSVDEGPFAAHGPEGENGIRDEHRNRRSEATGFVAPGIRTMAIPADWLDSYNMESFQYSQVEKGNDPGEVFGVREYREGDSPKQIHWKLSAKLDELTVKIPSLPIENNILVILDNQLEPGTALEPETKSRVAEDFCSLSMSLIEKGIPHSIGWYDTVEKTFRQRMVRNPEELMAAVPEVLGCGFAESEASAVYRYLESGNTAGFTNHFLVTAQGGRDMERLEIRGAVKRFRTKE